MIFVTRKPCEIKRNDENISQANISAKIQNQEIKNTYKFINLKCNLKMLNRKRNQNTCWSSCAVGELASIETYTSIVGVISDSFA